MHACVKRRYLTCGEVKWQPLRYSMCGTSTNIEARIEEERCAPIPLGRDPIKGRRSEAEQCEWPSSTKCLDGVGSEAWLGRGAKYRLHRQIEVCRGAIQRRRPRDT